MDRLRGTFAMVHASFIHQLSNYPKYIRSTVARRMRLMGARNEAGRRATVPVRVLMGAIAVLLVWLAIGGVGGQSIGQLSQLQKNDAASFLPEGAESTRVRNALAAFQDDAALPLIVVATRDGGLQPADLALAQSFAAQLPGAEGDLPDGRTLSDFLATPPGVPVPAIPSEDGEAFLIVLPLRSDRIDGTIGEERALTLVADTVQGLVDRDLAGAGLTAYVTGPAGFISDLTSAFAGIDGILLGVALLVVLLILLVVYRSPILPFAVLLTAIFGLSAAGFVVYRVAEAGWITVSGQSQGILS